MKKQMTSATQLLAIPSSFRQTALALPDKVRQAVALLDDPAKLNEMLAQANAYTAYTQHLHHSTEVNNALQLARLEIQAGLGRVLPAKTRKESGAEGGRGKKKRSGMPSPTFSPDAEKQFRKVHCNAPRIDEYRAKVNDYNAALPDDSPDTVEISTAGFLRFVGSGGILATKHNNDVIEWYTPEKYIDAVRSVMDGIDLDPATSKAAQKTVRAKRYYTKDSDGLAKEWSGTVFLNPPFKMPLVAQFVAKLIETCQSGAVSQAILLTNNNTDTDWWQSAAKAAMVICFTDGRVSFYNDAGAWSAPTNGQTFMYFGKRVVKFRETFAPFGLCLKP